MLSDRRTGSLGNTPISEAPFVSGEASQSITFTVIYVVFVPREAVDKEGHVDDVPTLFEHTKQRLLLVKRKEERQQRIYQRRQVGEIQQEASNAVRLAKQAAEWERKATAATKQIGMKQL